MIKYTAALDVGSTWNWQSAHDSGLIIGCHGYCPSDVIGEGYTLPYNRFTKAFDSNDVIRYRIKFGLKG